MRIDCHVHVVGNGTGGTGCWYRPRGITKFGAPMLVRAIGLPASALEGDLDRLYAEQLLRYVRESSLDAAVILAQDEPYTENGELEIPGVGTLKGRKAIRDFLGPLASAVSVSATEMRSDSIAVTGNVARSTGHYRQVAGPKGGPPAEYRGAFHATWAREADGQWRISRLVMEPSKNP